MVAAHRPSWSFWPILSVAICALVSQPVLAQSPSFGFPSFSGTVSRPVNFQSTQWVRDFNTSEYSPSLDQQVRFHASPWARSARLNFSSGALFSGDVNDRIDFGWVGASPADFEHGGTMPLDPLFVPASGTNSAMAPGLAFRFRTGPSPTTQSGDSEAAGFVVSTFDVIAGSTIGSTVATTLKPYERAVVLLNPDDAILDFSLPLRSSNEQSSFAAWLDVSWDPNASRVGVWARCGAFPDAANWDRRQFFATNLPVYMELPSCTGLWYVTIGSTSPTPTVVHATTGAHYTSRRIGHLRVGVKLNATPAQRSGIAYGFRSAAWRVYGASMGSTLFSQFSFYNNSNCSRIDGCGGSGCNICVTQEVCRSNVSGFDGFMTICADETSDLLSNNIASIDANAAAAQVIAHEFGHMYLAQPDEYWKGVTNCAGGTFDHDLCGHSIMGMLQTNRQGICTAVGHRQTPWDESQPGPPNTILGPYGYACNGGAGWLDATPGWNRMAGIVPGGVIPTFTAQNLTYTGQGFAGKFDLGAPLWF